LKKVYLFHKGIQHADQTCFALQESNQLHRFVTSRFFIKNKYPYKILNLFPDKSYIKKRLFTRYNKNLNVKNIKLFGLFSWINLILNFFSLGKSFNKYEYEYFSKRVIKDIEKDIKNIDIIWGFNNYSYDVFKKFKKTKVIKVLDLTIAFILDAEKRFSKKNDIYQLSKVERDKQILEVKLADRIVVGSKFTQQSLINYKIPSSKIKIIPYGFDETLFKKEYLKKRILKKNQTLKILFVGTINKRKGADHLINAIKKFNKSKVKLLMIGENQLDININELPNNIEIKPFMQKKEFLKYFYKSHLFCFPTLFEGGTITVFEAVGAGLAILTTKESTHKITNFGNIKLKSGSEKSIVSAIKKILNKPSKIEEMSLKSIKLYDEYKWSNYRKKVSNFINEIKT